MVMVTASLQKCVPEKLTVISPNWVLGAVIGCVYLSSKSKITISLFLWNKDV